MSFREIAVPMISRGVPVMPLRPNSKDAFLPDWPSQISTDPDQIEYWNTEYPNANGAAVAVGGPGDVWFFEADAPEVFGRIQAETGHDLIAEVPTFMVRSRQGRGHVYFRNTPASVAMGNIGQTGVKHGDFSVRQRNQYVVAAGSIHPHSGLPYVALDPSAQILNAPDWFVDWIEGQRTEKAPAKGGQTPVDGQGLIPHGFIHDFLVTQAGRLRHMGLGGNILEAALLEVAHSRCAPPINDTQVKQVARSFEKYPIGTNYDLVLNQIPDQVAIATPVDQDLPVFEPAAFPEFPKYVFAGTSVYEGFVKPWCDYNAFVDYFMWLPAMALLLNYLGEKIKIKNPFGERVFHGNIYMVLVGKRGETLKSTSIEHAMHYFQLMGCLGDGDQNKTAEGRSLVWTPGSAEGLGLDAQKTNCKNIVMYYDELKKLTDKAGIENSSLRAELLTLYGSQKFGNTIKVAKQKYNIEAGTYSASLLTCCTDTMFPELWSRMAANDSGLNDRMFFAFQPEVQIKKKLPIDISTVLGAQKTRMLLDKACTQNAFEIQDEGNPHLQHLIARGNRYADRAYKWAIGIAVDLGLEVVDDECIERGCDIVKYEIAVKNYLKSYEANNKEAALQLKIRAALEMRGGQMSERDLKHTCHSDRTTFWNAAFYGLQKANIIRIEGTGVRGDPKIIQLLVKRDQEEV